MDRFSNLAEARDAYRLGKFEEALRLAEAALEQRPNDPPALELVGVCRLELGQIEEGLQALRKSTVLAPEEPDAWVNLALGYELAGQEEKAREAAEQATRLAPMNEKAADLLWRLSPHSVPRAEARELPTLTDSPAGVIPRIPFFHTIKWIERNDKLWDAIGFILVVLLSFGEIAAAIFQILKPEQANGPFMIGVSVGKLVAIAWMFFDTLDRRKSLFWAFGGLCCGLSSLVYYFGARKPDVDSESGENG